MKKAIMMILFSTLAFSVVPLYRVDDVSFVLENPREFFGMEFDLSARVLQNFLTVQDVLDLMNGATIVIDKSRLDLISAGVLVDPMLDSIGTLEFGTRNFKIGAFAKLDGNVELSLPKDLARILLGDMDFEENVEEQFNMFEGGIFIKAGGIFGMRFGPVGLGIRGGLYVPVVWFDPDSKVEFVYESTSEPAYIHSELSGGSRFFTTLNSFNNIDTQELIDSAGYFIDLGMTYSYGPLTMGVSVDNVSLKSAILKYYAYLEATFEATYENLNFETAGPDYSLSDKIEPLDSPKEISAPMTAKALVLYNPGWFSIGAHLEYILDLGSWKAGGYIALYDSLWMDVSRLSSGYWEKLVGLDLDLRFLRMSLTAGVLDDSVLNLDPSKMIGISLHAGIGLGF